MSVNPIFVDPVRRPEDGRDNLLKYVEFIGKDPRECQYIEVGKCLFVEYLKQREPRPEEAQPAVLDKLMLLKFKKSSDEDIREVLERGICCDVQFNFLGYSNEQLLERCCLMIMCEPHRQIWDELCTFAHFHEVHPIDKRAEQIGLLFSCFTNSLKLKKGEFVVMDENHEVPFSADCGIMSAELSEEIRTLCDLQNAPSVVHVRYQGYQGLLVRQMHIEEETREKVKFRKSMEMFKIPPSSLVAGCLPDTLGIMGYSKPYSMGNLDTLSIMLLVNRGVKPEYIDELQEKYYRHLSTVNRNMAQWFLSRTEMSTHYAGVQYPATTSQQLEKEMNRIQQEEIRKIKQEGIYSGSDGEQRQKVRVLVFRSREVFGFRDTKLKPGQCFFKPKLPIEEQQPFESAKRLLIMRRPCYNPGHIRVLELVHNGAEIPADYQGIQDCLMLGAPSDCEECGAGKLDSDSAKYFVSWDENLIPTKLSRQSSLMDCLKPLRSLGETLKSVLGAAAVPVQKEEMLIELRDFFVSFKNPLPLAEELFMGYACSKGPSSEKCRILSEPLCGKMDIQAQRRGCQRTVEELQPNNNGIRGEQEEEEEEEDAEGQEEDDPMLVEIAEGHEGRDRSCLPAFLLCRGRGRQVESGGEEEEMRANLEVLRTIEERALQFLQKMG